MMDHLQIVILALVQGITEFLPISSSAHLYLVPLVTNWTDQGLLINLALHIGTLLAVLIYFRADIIDTLVNSWWLAKEKTKVRSWLMLHIIIATVPVMLVGLLVYKIIGEQPHGAALMGWMSIIFGVVLWYCDTKRPADKPLAAMTWREALLIGASQIIALIPGVSRSGITMSSARWLGFTRAEAARFSMLIAIPTIAAASLLPLYSLWTVGTITQLHEALLGIVLSFVFAYATIVVMMRWLKEYSFTPFVIYRILLGLVLLSYAYFI